MGVGFGDLSAGEQGSSAHRTNCSTHTYSAGQNCTPVYRETGRETVGEWFQWLAERFAEREGAAPPVPANVQYRDWRPR